MDELDELRRLLDSKTPLRSTARAGGHQSYLETIDATSAQVNRLGDAIARAEAGVEASMPRRDGVAMAVSAQRDSEVKELRRILASKESAIDSLRETLSGAAPAGVAGLHTYRKGPNSVGLSPLEELRPSKLLFWMWEGSQ